MSRSMSPPSTLSKEEKLVIADVRRDIWTSAFKGMGYGSVGCFLTHSVALMAQNRGLFKGSLNRNTAMFAFLGGGALGSFLMSSATGKNQVHNLHPIFEVGKREPSDGLTEYQRSLQQAQESTPNTNTQLPLELRKNRTIRRNTMRETIEKGHGLSDSHGGQWVEDNDGGKK
jgi:hypothetical protein